LASWTDGTARGHPPGCSLRAGQGAQQVDPQHLLELAGGLIENLPEADDARVVDHEPERPCELVQGRLDRRLVGDVTGQRGSAQLRSRLLHARAWQVEERDPPAVRLELARDLSSEAACDTLMR